ncbi:MAG: hypothetical protein U0169_09175 [Polyangiaceae bacterium]
MKTPLVRRATAGLLALSLSTSLVSLPCRTAYAADVTITPEARARFTAGVNLLKDPEAPRYEEAYREFKAAYAASPSYKILGNLGLCAMKLERDDEAIDAYDKYLKEAVDLDPAERAQIETDLQTLKTGVVHVVLKSDPPGATIVDQRVTSSGTRVTNFYGPLQDATKLGLRSGTHEFVARLAGYPDQKWELNTMTSGKDAGEHEFKFEKAPEAVATPATQPVAGPRTTPTRPVPTGVYVGLAATGAFAIGTAITGILATGKKSDFDAVNNGSDPKKADDIRGSGQTLNVVTDVFLGATVVAAGVTAVLFFTRPTVEVASPPAAAFAPRNVRVVPVASTHAGGLTLGGEF